MKYTTEDFVYDVDKLQFENDNEKAYYQGKADGYATATNMALEAKELELLEDKLTSYRRQLIQDKNELIHENNRIEEDLRFVRGQQDAIDEVRDLLYDMRHVEEGE